MDVYFEKSYWECQREGHEEKPGEEIRLEMEFTWEGRDWRIPAVYVCEQGLVADFCCRIAPAEIRAFYEKWGSREEECLSEEERGLLERENPFALEFRVDVQADGRELLRQSGCGTAFCPPALHPEGEAMSMEAEQVEGRLMDTYRLDPESGWVFWRNSFAWREAAPSSVRSFVFTFTKPPVCMPGPRFRTRQGETGRQVAMTHPADGRTYVLTVLGQEAETLERQGFPPELGIQNWPTHVQVLRYQVEPELPDGEPAVDDGIRLELPDGELTVSDCAQSDLPAYREPPAAASVAVIGRADGPTSFFVAGKLPGDGRRPKEQVAYSALHYEPTETVEWKTTFRVPDNARKVVRAER